MVKLISIDIPVTCHFASHWLTSKVIQVGIQSPAENTPWIVRVPLPSCTMKGDCCFHEQTFFGKALKIYTKYYQMLDLSNIILEHTCVILLISCLGHFHISNPRCTSFSSAPCRKTRAARKKKPGSFLVLTFGQSWEIKRFSNEYRLSVTNNFALRSLGYNFESHQAECILKPVIYCTAHWGWVWATTFYQIKKKIPWKDTQIPIVNANARHVCNKNGTLSEAVNPS